MMTKTSVTLVLALVTVAPLAAQTRGVPVQPPPAPTSNRPVPRPVAMLPIKLEDQWTTAVVRRDAQTFERCSRQTSCTPKTRS